MSNIESKILEALSKDLKIFTLISACAYGGALL